MQNVGSYKCSGGTNLTNTNAVREVGTNRNTVHDLENDANAQQHGGYFAMDRRVEAILNARRANIIAAWGWENRVDSSDPDSVLLKDDL